MGEVWEATGPGGGRVALKLLDAGASGNRAGLRRFLDEARLGAALHHPNLVPVIDAGQTSDGFAYLAMERLEGRPLNTLLSASGPRLPLGLVVELGLQALRALEAVHGFHTADGVARPIIHRDLKPSNLFLTTEGRLKVIDFGIAAGFDVDRTRTGTGQGHGTVRYSSPEQAAGLDPDARTDLFAWGLVMHELLTGRLVFDQPTDVAVLNALVHQPIPSVSSRRPDVPAELVAVLERVLEKDRERRASSAAEVARALETVLPQAQRWTECDVADWLSRQAEWAVGAGTATGDPVAPPAAPEVAEVAARPPRARRLVVAAVAGVAVVAVAGLGLTQLGTSGAPAEPAGVEAARDAGREERAVAAASGGGAPAADVPEPADAGGPPPAAATPEPRRPSAPRGRGWLTVDVQPAFGQVTIDGRTSGVTPLYRVPLPAGPHRVEVTRDDGLRRARQVTVKADQESVARFRW